MRAGQPVPGGAPVETAPPAAAAGAQEIPDDQLPPGEESIADFDPAQINPPEQPENLIQDTDELNAANEANAPAGSRKGAGRPKGSVTVKPQTDEGYIFAEVFKVVIGVLMANPLVEDPIETAGEIARGAIAEFRKPIA